MALSSFMTRGRNETVLLCNLTIDTISRQRLLAMFFRSLCFLVLTGLFAIGTAQQPVAPYSFEWELVAVDCIPGMATLSPRPRSPAPP